MDLLHKNREATCWLDPQRGPRKYCFSKSDKECSSKGLDKAQAEIKIARRNVSNLRYADDTTPMEESEEEQKGLLMKVKEESEKAG